MGERLVFDGNDEHAGKLQPLRRVQRHHRDVVVGTVERVGVGDQRGLLEV